MTALNTVAPTAEQITGRWIIRFAGDRKQTGVITRRNWADTGLTFGDQKVYETPIHVCEENGTNLASARKIIEIAGFKNVSPLIGWEFDENLEMTSNEFKFM